MTKRNRSLDTIADDIHKLARSNIFDIGACLLEARELCEHGQWLGWLFTEFKYAVSTAERYMNAARLRAKFPIVGNLRICANTVYALAECKEGDLPTVIEELAKHATEKQLKHKEAERVIKIGIGRHRHGDRPDATLVWLIDLENNYHTPWHPQAVAELLKQNPETDEIASSIVDEAWQAHCEAERKAREAKDEAEREAEAILDGDPPELPSSIVPPEPQQLEAETDWAEKRAFDNAVSSLLMLRSKPLARMIGTFSLAQLREAADFLMAVATATEQKETADQAETEAETA